MSFRQHALEASATLIPWFRLRMAALPGIIPVMAKDPNKEHNSARIENKKA